MPTKTIKRPPTHHRRRRVGAVAPRPAAKPPAEPERRLIHKDKVLERLGVTWQTVCNWIMAGEFPKAVEVGGRIRFFSDEIDHWVATRPRRTYKGARS